MSKKLTIQAVRAAHDAAADANTKANEVRGALRARLSRDRGLALDLTELLGVILSEALGSGAFQNKLDARHREQLEPTANSYGYTLVDHPRSRDLVVVQPLEN